jgi:hypothetical protein
MDTTKNTAPPATRVTPGSTRHHRCDEDFLNLLEEDFGIPRYALSTALMGCPREPKKSCIALCEWASSTNNPGRALMAWARKNGRGTFRPDSSADDE